MTPGARAVAAAELLDAIIDAARGGGAAADTIIARYFKTRRYAGSHDRRAIRELVYQAIRASAEAPENGAAALAAVAEGGQAAPAAPAWLAEDWRASGLGSDELAGLHARAPLDLRVNRARATLAQVRAAFPDATPVEGVPDTLRIDPARDVEQHPLFRAGAFEVQDAGSQIVALASGAANGMTVVDLCAGGGGKTLALAAMMANRGTILACDADRARLAKLAPRAERAGITIASTRLLDPGRERAALADWAARADVVLVDAPCSGTGTWRRNPEARWRLTRPALDRLIATQARLLDLAATLVRPGGAVVHIVCSLLDAEGAGQAARFLARHPDWNADVLTLPRGTAHGAGVRLTPNADSTDGFFVARMRAPC